MQQLDLIELFPWANNPNILPFAETFTQKQWQNINDAGLPKLLPTMDPTYIVAFFQGCEMCVAATGLEISVVDAIVASLKTQLQTSPIHIPDVLAWLGPNLSKRVEQDTESYAMMDDLMQLLSSKEIRDKFERPIVSQNKKLNNRDLRVLYHDRQITLNEFLDILRSSTQLSQRQFPEWIGEHVEIKALADEFTDEQLVILPTLLSNSILNDRELTCSFLRTILAKTTVNDLQEVKKCPLDSFRLIVQSLETLFLNIATQRVARFNIIQMEHLAQSISDLRLSEKFSLAHTIIRKYVTQYKAIPIPVHEENEALHCALRNAANVGNYWDLLPLTLLTKTVNLSGGQSGKTALHRAVEYMNKTGNRLCFDLLANHPDIDFSIADSEGNTALDLWDFERFPDASLLSILNELKVSIQVKRAASPLTANSIFLPESTAAVEEENKEECTP